MKILFTVASILFFSIISIHSTAQIKPFSIGAYGEVAFPTGDFSNVHNIGFGGGLTADITLPVGFGITGSAGYMHFPGKSVNNIKTEAINAFPIRAGIKYKLPIIYFKLEGGVATFSGGGPSAVIFSPGIGAKLTKFDIQGKYEVWARNGSSAFWGIRFATNF